MDAEELEATCAEAWPALTERRLGGWRLRAAGGFTGRANSVLPLGDPGGPVPDALAAAERFAAEHGIPPKAQVVTGTVVERAIIAAGWRHDAAHSTPGGVLVLTGDVSSLGSDTGGAAVLDRPTPDWFALTAGDTEPDAAARHVLTGADRVGYGLLGVAAAVRGAVVGDVLHVSRLQVRAELRRGGLARRVLAAVGCWAAEAGATRCVLQVASDNAAALALYGGLGCVEHHRYRYWTPA